MGENFIKGEREEPGNCRSSGQGLTDGVEQFKILAAGDDKLPGLL